jgi:hypothetical protein
MTLRVSKAVRERLGDEGTFGLIEMFDAAHAAWSEQVLSLATDRFERRLIEEIAGLREEFHRTLQEGLADVRREIATTRFDLLKWSFVFWIGQVTVVAGLLAYMLSRP